MRVGTSLSRCVRDIFNGVIKQEEVLVIVARTDVDPENDKHWSSLWRGYAGGGGNHNSFSHPEWFDIPAEKEQELREICISLKKQGKLHQPRQYGAHPIRMPEYWYDLVLTTDTHQDNPAANKAWENYKIIAGLL
jgi:hypothetical protein